MGCPEAENDWDARLDQANPAMSLSVQLDMHLNIKKVIYGPFR